MPNASIRRHLRHGMLPQLAVFEAAARLGSFTRAAQALHLAQPTVSTQLRKLSDTLELPLFEKIGRKVHLTPAGVALYEGCSQLFATFERIEQTLSGLRGLESGRLRVAISPTAAYFAPALLARFAERHPGVEVALQIHNRQRLIERLTANADDLYLFVHPPADHELVRQPVRDVSFAFFARADHPLARERDLPLARLAGEPLLVREAGSGARDIAVRAFERAGQQPRVRMELASDDAIVQAIRAGVGIGLLARESLPVSPVDRPMVELDIRGFPLARRWQFVYPVGKQVSPATRAFIELVRSTYGPRDRPGGPAPDLRR